MDKRVAPLKGLFLVRAYTDEDLIFDEWFLTAPDASTAYAIISTWLSLEDGWHRLTAVPVISFSCTTE